MVTELVDQPTVEIAGKIIKQAARIGVGGAEGCFALKCAQQMTEAVDIDAAGDGRFEGCRGVERIACQGVETAEIQIGLGKGGAERHGAAIGCERCVALFQHLQNRAEVVVRFHVSRL